MLFRRHSNKVVQAKEGEIATSSAPNLLASKFAERFEKQAHTFENDNRFAKGLIRYNDLLGHIQNMKTKFETELEERKQEILLEDCSICSQNLGQAGSVLVTACDHSFHTLCFVKTLRNSTCTSCPQCKTEFEKLVPNEIESESLTLVSKFQSNANQAEDCHRSVLEDIQCRTVTCLRKAEALRSSKSKWLSSPSSKKARLLARISALVEDVDLLQQFGQISAEGFSKLCKKISKNVSSELAETLEEECVRKQSFFQDCHELGAGLTRALRQELSCIANMVGGAPVVKAPAASPTIKSPAVPPSDINPPVTIVRIGS